MGRSKFWGVVISCGFLFISHSVIALAEERNLELEKIIVTAARYPQEIAESTSSVTLITQDDIKNSNAQNITDVLRPVPGLVVRDYYGNGVKASVDSRGFGEQGGMNVLVMIDGRRVNEVDLSAADWTQIPIEQIDRIEVIRGGLGSVLYGDNATSGVINIITKKGRGAPHIELGIGAGSYGMNKQSVNLSGLSHNISYWINAIHNENNGYRKNSYYKAQDFGMKLESKIDAVTSLRFGNSFHTSEYGMPGALRDSHLAVMSRRDTAYPGDHANDRDFYFDLGADRDFGVFGKLDVDISFRRREVYTHIGSYNPVYKNKIDTFGVSPKYILDKEIFGLRSKLISGIDFYRSDYSSDNYNDSVVMQNSTDINKITIGCYLQDELTILDNLIMTGGYRFESARYEFDYTDLSGSISDIDQDVKPNKNAYNLGVVYKYGLGSSVFANFNRSFRFPATDEYLSVYASPPVNTALKPQTSQNYEIGIKHNVNSDLSLGLSLYRMNIKNELFYNPLTYANENYDKTRHSGCEFSLSYRLNKNFGLYNNYSWTKSTFVDGTYGGRNVPMVPRHKDSFGLRFTLKDWILNFQGNYVGERYFINDQGNNLSRLNGYFTMDTNLSYKYKDFSVIVGINNLLNKKYSEYGAYSTVYLEKGYYPSPERNYFLKIGYSF